MKRNLIVIAIISLTLISAEAAFGQSTGQRLRSQRQPGAGNKLGNFEIQDFKTKRQRGRIETPNRSVYQKIELQKQRRNRGGQHAQPNSGARTNSRQPRNTNLTKVGAGTLNAAKNKTPQTSRSGIQRGKTRSGIIMANTEGDFHIKGKSRQPR